MTAMTQGKLPTRLQFHLAVWAGDTISEWDGDEIRQAHEMIGSVRGLDNQVRALQIAAELWLDEPDAIKDKNLDNVTILALVIAMFGEGFPNWDSTEFREYLTSVHNSEDEALLAGLGLLKDQARANGYLADLEGLTLASLDSDNRREGYLWMTNTAPGYDWVHVEGLGYVLYRLS